MSFLAKLMCFVLLGTLAMGYAHRVMAFGLAFEWKRSQPVKSFESHSPSVEYNSFELDWSYQLKDRFYLIGEIETKRDIEDSKTKTRNKPIEIGFAYKGWELSESSSLTAKGNLNFPTGDLTSAVEVGINFKSKWDRLTLEYKLDVDREFYKSHINSKNQPQKAWELEQELKGKYRFLPAWNFELKIAQEHAWYLENEEQEFLTLSQGVEYLWNQHVTLAIGHSCESQTLTRSEDRPSFYLWSRDGSLLFTKVKFEL